MMNFNPMHYLKHAWEATNSAWGKLCIVLFYAFIWIQIIWAVQVLIAPTWGFECFWGRVKGSDYNASVALMKNMNIWTIGFLLYADRGGIKVWNVFMVWFFYLVQWLQYKPAVAEFADGVCDDELSSYGTTMMITEIWIFLALICSWMDTRIGGSASPGETRPLNV